MKILDIEIRCFPAYHLAGEADRPYGDGVGGGEEETRYK